MKPDAAAVLSAFGRDEVRLFVSAASITVGLLAVAFSLIRRRFDRLLSFFAWFAVLYGFRLWMQSETHGLMAPESPALEKLQMGLNFFVAVPAFQFFEASGWFGRTGRVVVYAVCAIEMLLIGAMFVGVSLRLLDQMNSACVILGSVSLAVLSFRQRAVQKDALIVRAGVLIFVAFVFWNNAAELLGHRTAVELYGYVAFLCCVGYVAANRALERDQQLRSIQPRDLHVHEENTGGGRQAIALYGWAA